ncbi:MAG TPA: hypothetical protein VNZ26_10115 [Vicinamibacterales bacterium]|jgi:hypothetical protein|nr:hypothetical protein [Vicinamibacterales bacterium]
MNRRSLIAGIVIGLVGLTGNPSGLRAEERHSETRTIVLDVAIDAHTLSLNNNDPADPANPRRGSTFIVYGKIFPGGTIPSGVTPFDPSGPGSIGDWICRGVFLADFADIASGTASLAFDTTQMFELSTDRNAVFTEGFEGNVGVTTHRTLTGGTGRFRGITGTVKQETIGVNRNGAADGLFDLRFTFMVDENK